VSSKSKIVMLLLTLSWVSQFVHRFLTNHVPEQMFFPLSKAHTDIQWYVYDLGQIFSYICILSAMAICVRKIEYVFILTLTCLSVQILDVVHYVLWFKQSEIFFLFENLIFLAGIIVIFIRNGHKKRAG
jgi:hypothetical protein